MADLERALRRGAFVVRRQPVLRSAVHLVVAQVRSHPQLVDVLARVAALEGRDRVLPLHTQDGAVASRRALHPDDEGPERWPVVGVETHHLDAQEEQAALAAVTRQQVEQPWFRPVFLCHERSLAAARSTGCPFDLVPAHATDAQVVGQRVADLIEGFGATWVLRAGPDGLEPEHLAALATLAHRQRRRRQDHSRPSR